MVFRRFGLFRLCQSTEAAGPSSLSNRTDELELGRKRTRSIGMKRTIGDTSVVGSTCNIEAKNRSIPQYRQARRYSSVAAWAIQRLRRVL